jgi:hypothetical protein
VIGGDPTRDPSGRTDDYATALLALVAELNRAWRTTTPFGAVA